GFWTPPRFLQGEIEFQQQFQAEYSDIILVTTPKSGTIWLKSLLFTLVNRVKHHVFEHNHPLLVNNPHVLVPFLEHKLYIDGRVPDFSTFTSPRLLATHMPFSSLPKSVKDSKIKLVYLCRNLRDTFISICHFSNNLLFHHNDTNSFEEMFDLFCEGVSLYDPF
uniref:Sulfotransferase n=1 Tax=Solanum lycopersicum TaxID=4081 RepID=A0A3Q7IX21_SOLLC